MAESRPAATPTGESYEGSAWLACDATDRCLSARHLSTDTGSLQVLPVVFVLRGAGDQGVRHTPRVGARGLASSALQSVEPWGP